MVDRKFCEFCGAEMRSDLHAEAVFTTYRRDSVDDQEAFALCSPCARHFKSELRNIKARIEDMITADRGERSE